MSYDITQKLMLMPSSSSHRVYEIRIGKDEVAYCTCRDWAYRQSSKRFPSGQKGACKHMLAAYVVLNPGKLRYAPDKLKLIRLLEQSLRDNGLLASSPSND